jgi:hypothetical protein
LEGSCHLAKPSRLGQDWRLWLLLLLRLLHWHRWRSKVLLLLILAILRLGAWEASVLGLQRRRLLKTSRLRLEARRLRVHRKPPRLGILLLRKAIWLLILVIGVELLLLWRARRAAGISAQVRVGARKHCDTKEKMLKWDTKRKLIQKVESESQLQVLVGGLRR